MSSKTIFIGLSLIFLTAKCAVLKYEDTLNRNVRTAPITSTPSLPSDISTVTPSPSSPHFQTQQWSGLTRSKDGSQQGVFSGAAATLDSGHETSGDAFSIATSSVKSGLSNRFGGDCNNGPKQYQNNGVNFGNSAASNANTRSDGPYKISYFDDNQQQVPSSGLGGYGSYSGAQSATLSNTYGSQGSPNFAYGFLHDQDNRQQQTQFSGHGQGQNQVGGGQYTGGADYRFVESGIPAHNGAYKNNQRYFQNHYGYNDYQQQRPADYGESSGAHSQSYSSSNSQTGNQYGGYSNGGVSGYHDSYSQRGDQGFLQQQNGYRPIPQQESPRGFQGTENQQVEFSRHEQQYPGYSQANNGQVGSPANDNIRETLGDALNLASQGLQASQQSNCSTCGKSSYAFSNAKSNSGSAIALSIGG